MNLNLEEWKEFKLGKLFLKPYKAKAFNKEELEESAKSEESIRYITRTGENNGCEMLVKRNGIPVTAIEKGNAISIGDTTATCFYQSEDFITGDHMGVIRAEWLNIYNALFILAFLNKEQYKYSYGRAFLMDRISETTIKLPVQHNEDGTFFIDSCRKYSDEGYVPDWEFIENYIKSLKHKPLTTKNNGNDTLLLIHNDWKEFTLNDVFELKGGFYNKKPEHSVEGKIPFLASTESNNGVTEFYSLEDIKSWDKVGNEDDTLDKKLYKGNCIAVTVNGSVCNAFYQKEQFTCSHDITAFYVKKHEMNPALAMFLCTIIMKDKYRWSYGRKPHDVKKFGKSVIKLPIKHNPDRTPFIDVTRTYSEEGYVPDWQYMEQYIKSLPYGDRV